MASLRSGSNRAPSPTGTTYSGISNYRSETYRPLRDKAPPMPALDSRKIAQAHWDELFAFLEDTLSKEPQASRANARQKLTRLTKQQFHELSTDVYDELIRRNNNTSKNEVPFLPVRDDFHPKRNQARQKLATLPKGRFKDLAGDVFHELGQRYPEFKEPEVLPPPQTPDTPGSAYDDGPPAQSKTSFSPPRADNTSIYSRPSNDFYASSTRRPSQDDTIVFNDRRPSRDDTDVFGGRKPSLEQSQYTKSSGSRPSQDELAYGSRPSMEDSRSVASSRRRPSEDAGGSAKTYGRRPSQEANNFAHDRRPSADRGSSANTNPYSGSPALATARVIVPTKSTIAEEDIEVPSYGGGGTDSFDDGPDDPDMNDSRLSLQNRMDDQPDTPMAEDLPLETPVKVVGGGLSALGASFFKNTAPQEEHPESDYDDDKQSNGRASATSGDGLGVRGRQSLDRGDDELRKEYELKIATMQRRIQSLEADLGDSAKAHDADEDRIQELNDEVKRLRGRLDSQSREMQELQHGQDDIRELELQAQRDHDEIDRLKNRCETLERERTDNVSSNMSSSAVDKLRSQVQSLVDELNDAAQRADEMAADKESDLVLIQDLRIQIEEYKKKYEQAKTELRNVKATSQLFSVQAPKVGDGQLPVSENGGIRDMHMTAVQSAIDSLLTAARSSSPGNVLTPTKVVVNAVTAIVDDVKAFERRPRRERMDVEEELLRSLRERAEATLSNLVSTSKTHATSYGLSPVSLMDAAASHVAATIVEIVKLIHLCKTPASERDRSGSVSSLNGGVGKSSFNPSLQSVDERRTPDRPGHGRMRSSSSNRDEVYSPPNRFGSAQSYRNDPNKRTSDPDRSSSNASPQPTPLFDRPRNTGASDGSGPGDGLDDGWEELKPYLEAQSESIVINIQHLLAAIRQGAQGRELDEYVTPTTTIVASIVAVCRDNLPSSAGPQGKILLDELSSHSDKLIEAHVAPEITKQTRQIMASSGIAIAKTMKELMKL